MYFLVWRKTKILEFIHPKHAKRHYLITNTSPYPHINLKRRSLNSFLPKPRHFPPTPPIHPQDHIIETACVSECMNHGWEELICMLTSPWPAKPMSYQLLLFIPWMYQQVAGVLPQFNIHVCGRIDPGSHRCPPTENHWRTYIYWTGFLV